MDYRQCCFWPEIEPALRVGVIVQPSEECMFSNRFGEVKGIFHDDHPDGPIEVFFPAIHSYLSFVWDHENAFVRFQAEDLRTFPDWPIHEQALVLFGSGFHYYYEPKGEGRPEICMHKGCDDRALDQWTLVNYWGSIIPFACCYQHHARLHGMRTESLAMMKCG